MRLVGANCGRHLLMTRSGVINMNQPMESPETARKYNSTTLPNNLSLESTVAQALSKMSKIHEDAEQEKNPAWIKLDNPQLPPNTTPVECRPTSHHLVTVGGRVQPAPRRLLGETRATVQVVHHLSSVASRKLSISCRQFYVDGEPMQPHVQQRAQPQDD